MNDLSPVKTWTCFSVSIEAGVAHVQLNRPDAMNAMNRAFWNELPEIINDISDNARARVIVISSTGKHFSAGMDLSVFTSGGGVGSLGASDREVRNEAFRYHVRHLQDTFSCFDRARMPVLVACQGGVIGGAMDMIAACDIRYATEDAFFCIQEINIAMAADVGTFPRLCKLIPEGWVREMAYTGRRVSAAKAKEIGLVNEVYPTHEALVEAVMATAREIAAQNPLAITSTKAFITHARDHSTYETLDFISVWQTGMWSTAHMAEAFTAKQEKRAPVYPDLAPLKKHM
jgi:enoyl-CoA hydratase